jgi:SAM-dependent methyltransferase
MDLDELQRHWDELGKRDPFWAVLTDPQKKGRKWDPIEFFKTGEEEIACIMEYVESLGFPLPRNRALDFGCGVGRLSQALCGYFKRCCGVDIASSMIELAKTYNRYGNRCQYYVNESDDLRLFENDSFDFIYSNIVLQHMRPKYSKKYIQEFLRTLAPGGLLIFQIPSEPVPERNVNCEALPDSAFKMQLAVQSPPTTMEAGAQTTLQIKVINESDVTWPATGTSDGSYRVRLGNHWLDTRGKVLINDDGRADFLADIAPLEEISLPLTVTAPRRPGRYILELDLVQESVTWFKDKGAKPLRIVLHVKRNLSNIALNLYRRLRRDENEDGEHILPRIEMYSVPQETIVALIERNEGEIVDIQEDHWPGPGWISFRYCATKRSFV